LLRPHVFAKRSVGTERRRRWPGQARPRGIRVV